ncbi:hypothetical protein HOF78_04100 [Candidatus Woesearchaeota archaeon]|jgi:hypothetical protein|nr:hypothetical protein [Candidatus Woesearchaeota archaeon]MBT6023476.1 hypothetical protein [Candidatus Woesearchaeota archaeon]MBT6044456.1 hypothetical protein [Candidatus Woesearchaeota archaeon]
MTIEKPKDYAPSKGGMIFMDAQEEVNYISGVLQRAQQEKEVARKYGNLAIKGTLLYLGARTVLSQYLGVLEGVDVDAAKTTDVINTWAHSIDNIVTVMGLTVGVGLKALQALNHCFVVKPTKKRLENLV